MRCSVLLLFVAVAGIGAAEAECRFFCEPTLLVEPTITWEKDATVFETIFALDLSTPIPRVGVTLEAITKPFSDENEVELESELKLYWLEGEQTGGWLSSHFDIVDKFSPAKRPTDTRAYTHKLNFELDTAVAVFSRLPETQLAARRGNRRVARLRGDRTSEGCQPLVVFSGVRRSGRQRPLEYASRVDRSGPVT